MRILGIAIKKNEIWFSIVSGLKKSDAVVDETGKQNFNADSSTQSLMLDFYNIFSEAIAKYSPNKIAYKLFLDTKKDQIPYMHYSLGILNLLSKQNGIPIKERTSSWISAGKKSKIIRFNEYFNDNSYKTDEMVASLVAWYELED